MRRTKLKRYRVLAYVTAISVLIFPCKYVKALEIRYETLQNELDIPIPLDGYIQNITGILEIKDNLLEEPAESLEEQTENLNRLG